MDLERLSFLREKILNSNNRAGFIEQETIRAAAAAELAALPPSLQCICEVEEILGKISTPLLPEDVFAGRMLEAESPIGWPDGVHGHVHSAGHITLPVDKIVTSGLNAIVTEVQTNARNNGDEESLFFSECTARFAEAVKNFSLRYADAAEKAGKSQLAAACRVVPMQPAYDLFSALQSIWMIQFIYSTVIGARDFAPGKIDDVLEKFCTGTTDEMVELFAHFFIKFNEITGTATHDYEAKPIPCFATKQYITIGPDFGKCANLMVEAAAVVKLPQPTLNFRLDGDYELAGKAANLLDSQCNFWNYTMQYNKLLQSGIPGETAASYTYTACNRVDLPGVLYNKMELIDVFDNTTEWFRQALFAACDYESILPALYRIAKENIQEDLTAKQSMLNKERFFAPDSLAIDSCIKKCRDIRCGGADNIPWVHRMFSGIATMADSLAAMNILLQERTYGEILQILADDFAGHEELRQRIRNSFPKFGNGSPEADKAAASIANTLIDAFEDAAGETGFLPMASLYSLTRHHSFGSNIGATPDGRKAGTQISENQSPVHGMDTEGISAMLRSVAALPLHRCISGGLNVKLTSRLSSEQFAGIIKSFFEMNGQHIGFSVVDQATLQAALAAPEDYKSLCIRITGYSEYFNNLSPETKKEVIARTGF